MVHSIKSFLLAVLLGAACLVATRTGAADLSPADKYFPMTIADLVFRIDESADIGVAKDGIKLDILEKLRASGFHALGGENVVFGKDKSEDARFVLGGTVRELNCNRSMGWYDSTETCAILIAWELLDSKSDQIVYKVDTRAAVGGITKRFAGGQIVTNRTEKMKELIGKALESLMNRPKFAEMMLKSRPNAAPDVSEDTAYEKASYRKCAAQKLAMPKGAKTALSATVLIDTDNGFGSGVIISPDGFVLTAAHVVDGQKTVNVLFQDKREAAAKIIRFDRKHDVAVLRIKGEGYPCLTVDEAQADVGDKLFAVGSPASKELSFSLSSGIVSAYREWDGVRFLQTDASINPGNSGGPMINEVGSVMAVVSWKVAGLGVEGIGFGIPSGAAMGALNLVGGDKSDDGLLDAEAADTGPAKDPAATTFVDTPDSPIAVAAAVKTERKKDTRRAVKHALRWSGLALTLGGSALSIISFATAKSRGTKDDVLGLTYEEYETKKVGNTVGWILAGVGVAAFGTSFFIPNKKAEENEKEEKETVNSTALSPEWGIGIGVGQAAVQVRF